MKSEHEICFGSKNPTIILIVRQISDSVIKNLYPYRCGGYLCNQIQQLDNRMADITFAMERDSSHKAAKNKLDVRSKAKNTNRNQLAIAAVLFLGGIVGIIVLALYLMVQEGVFLY